MRGDRIGGVISILTLWSMLGCQPKPAACAVASGGTVASVRPDWVDAPEQGAAPDPGACAQEKEAVKALDSSEHRLALADCEAARGMLRLATEDAQKSLVAGIQARDAVQMRLARVKIMELFERLPTITFVPPAVISLVVRFDGRPVPSDALTKRFAIEPGEHHVVAIGVIDGQERYFREVVKVAERDHITVRIELTPGVRVVRSACGEYSVVRPNVVEKKPLER